MMAASILKASGYDDFMEVEGGLEAILKAGVPKVRNIYPIDR